MSYECEPDNLGCSSVELRSFRQRGKPLFSRLPSCLNGRLMHAMNGGALWTLGCLAAGREPDRKADGNSNCQPDAHISGNYAKHRAQCGSQCNAHTRVFWFAIHNLPPFHIAPLLQRTLKLSATPAAWGACRRFGGLSQTTLTAACPRASRTMPAPALPSWRCRR